MRQSIPLLFTLILSTPAPFGTTPMESPVCVPDQVTLTCPLRSGTPLSVIAPDIIQAWNIASSVSHGRPSTSAAASSGLTSAELFPKLSMALSKIYPYINDAAKSGQNFWQLFFKKNLTNTDDKYYSHQIRWHNTAQLKKFFRNELQDQFDDAKMYTELESYISPDFEKWHPFARAQYLEMRLFMAGYLLSSQGDRMMMGNSVEGRFPFLDHRVIEFANTIPPQYKMNVLNEKYILKKTYENILPSEILTRDKQPYRAPISQCFTNGHDNLASQLFSEDSIEKSGYFNNLKVNLLKQKIEKSNVNLLAARDDMAIVGIVSTQILHHHFMSQK